MEHKCSDGAQAMKNSEIDFLYLETPIGGLVLATRQRGLCRLSYVKGQYDIKSYPKTKLEHLAHSQLMNYFDKPHDRFTIPLDDCEQTPFRKRVWQALSEIKIGTTTTYKKIAQVLNTHPRAIGGACAANPIPIIIPCHRVIAQSGALCGYTGAGGNQDLSIKAQLLKHERQGL
ncbi:MAG: methylated-DNA--[protein]-cysteine S-methyltransferase [Chromatiales bacterium]|nr:methylated-DNA--[protein]-cysteine S-methyltransferase [Chromatiales bacterium]